MTGKQKKGKVPAFTLPGDGKGVRPCVCEGREGRERPGESGKGREGMWADRQGPGATAASSESASVCSVKGGRELAENAQAYRVF